MATDGSTRAILAAMFANLGIAIAKFVGFAMTGASSMLAEAIHSVADTSNQALLLHGGRAARRTTTPTHPFGYGRERYFWSFVVALVLFTVGGLFAAYEGIGKIRHPHELESAGVAIGVLVVGIALETWSFGTAIVESNRVRGQRSWWRFLRTAKTPELPVVLLEDAGAMFGLVFALVGVILASTVDPLWDGIATVAIGVLLIVIAAFLAVEMRSLLLGEAASEDDQRAIETTIREHPDVTDVLHVRTQHLGPDDLLVAGKLRLRGELTFAEVAAAIDAIEQAVRVRVPAVRMIYLEPGTELAPHERTPGQ